MEPILNDAVNELVTLNYKLSAGDRKFAGNLINFFKKNGYLSEKQEPWIYKLLDRAKNPPPPPEAIEVGDFDGVIELFQKAKANLKYPKIVLQAAGKPVILSVAGVSSKYYGTVSVAGEGKYPDRKWYGRVDANGAWTPARKIDESMANAVYELLIELAHDPAAVAQKYGALTGNCCFCNKKLTDARSTKAGFGSTCAQHYGLYDKWLAAADAAEVKATQLKNKALAENAGDVIVPVIDCKEKEEGFIEKALNGVWG